MLNQKKKKSKSSWKLSIRVRVVSNFRKVVIAGSFSSSIQTFENEIIDFFNDCVLRSLEISCSVANSMSILIAKFEMISFTRVPVLYAFHFNSDTKWPESKTLILCAIALLQQTLQKGESNK